MPSWSRFDAGQTLAQFAGTACDEVELERLTAELVHEHAAGNGVSVVEAGA